MPAYVLQNILKPRRKLDNVAVEKMTPEVRVCLHVLPTYALTF